MEEITDALSSSRTKGDYEVKVKEFFESGELAQDFSELFPNKESGNLRNNIKKYAKECSNGVEYQVVMHKNGYENDEPHVLLVNLEAYRLAQQSDEN